MYEFHTYQSVRRDINQSHSQFTPQRQRPAQCAERSYIFTLHPDCSRSVFSSSFEGVLALPLFCSI